MQKRLIVNADDLGLCDCVNAGIERAHREGIVTSSTLLANLPGFQGGVTVARNNPELGVGVHLNLIRGCPLTGREQAAPLLAADGRFLPSVQRIGRVCVLPEYLVAAEREYRAQIERVLEAGIRPTHLDFEKHHGIWAPLYAVAERLAIEYGLAIRSFREPLGFVFRYLGFPGVRAFWKSLHVGLYEMWVLRRRVTTSLAPGSPDWWFGQSCIGQLDERFLLALLESCPDGVSELMCHPGGYDADAMRRLAPEIGESWMHEARPGELAALTVPGLRGRAAAEGIDLCTFACFGATRSF